MNESVSSQPPVYAANQLELLDVLVVLVKNAMLLVFGSLAVGLMALGISYKIPPTFTATTRILPPQQQQSAAALLAQQLGSLAGLAGGATGVKSRADIYVAMLTSRTVADRIIDRFDLERLFDADSRDGAVKHLGARTRVKAGKDGVLTIQVDDRDPKRAADMANAYVAELREMTKTLAVGEAAQRRAFFESQLEQVTTKLTAAEIALGESGIGEAVLKADPRAATEGIARLKAELTAAEVRLSAMRGTLTDASVEVRQTQQEIAALRSQLTKAESNVSPAGGQGAHYIAKYRDFKYYETLFELMAKQLELAKLDEAREGALVQVLDPALPPQHKTKPRKALIAVATTVIVFMLLAIFSVLRFAISSAMSDPAKASKIQEIKDALPLRRR